MKLCMMSYTMARVGVKVEDIVDTARNLQLEGIDWVSTYGRDPAELRRLSDDAGLDVACHTFFLRSFPEAPDKALDDARAGLEAAVTLGAPVVMIPTMTSTDHDRSSFRDLWIDMLEMIAPYAADAGVALTVENFPGIHSAFVTADDFHAAQARVPDLKLTYDNGNAAGGEDPVLSFLACANDVVHVHFKDWIIRDTPAEGFRPMLNGLYFKPALIGEGDIDTRACWNALQNHGYDGFVNIEYEGTDHPPHEAMELAVSYLRRL